MVDLIYLIEKDLSILLSERLLPEPVWSEFIEIGVDSHGFNVGFDLVDMLGYRLFNMARYSPKERADRRIIFHARERDCNAVYDRTQCYGILGNQGAQGNVDYYRLSEEAVRRLDS